MNDIKFMIRLDYDTFKALRELAVREYRTYADQAAYLVKLSLSSIPEPTQPATPAPSGDVTDPPAVGEGG